MVFADAKAHGLNQTKHNNMAGKGPTYRPVNGEAWDKGYNRIDFSSIKGSNKFAPKQELKLDFKDLLLDDNSDAAKHASDAPTTASCSQCGMWKTSKV